MLREIRKTANGVEYWDTEAKKVIIGGVDLANGNDTTVETTIEVDGKVISQSSIELNEMTVKELKQYAADNLIDIPSDITKKDDIILFLSNPE